MNTSRSPSMSIFESRGGSYRVQRCPHGLHLSWRNNSCFHFGAGRSARFVEPCSACRMLVVRSGVLGGCRSVSRWGLGWRKFPVWRTCHCELRMQVLCCGAGEHQRVALHSLPHVFVWNNRVWRYAARNLVCPSCYRHFMVASIEVTITGQVLPESSTELGNSLPEVHH